MLGLMRRLAELMQRPYTPVVALCMLIALALLGFGTVETHIVAFLAGFTMALAVSFPRPEEKSMCHVAQVFAVIVVALSAVQYHLTPLHAALMFLETELYYAVMLYLFTLFARARQM